MREKPRASTLFSVVQQNDNRIERPGLLKSKITDNKWLRAELSDYNWVLEIFLANFLIIFFYMHYYVKVTVTQGKFIRPNYIQILQL